MLSPALCMIIVAIVVVIILCIVNSSKFEDYYSSYGYGSPYSMYGYGGYGRGYGGYGGYGRGYGGYGGYGSGYGRRYGGYGGYGGSGSGYGSGYGGYGGSGYGKRKNLGCKLGCLSRYRYSCSEDSKEKCCNKLDGCLDVCDAYSPYSSYGY